MKSERRKMALVIDNTPDHKIFELNDVELIFLPSNMTGVVQVLDAGIIRFFKAHYRLQQMNYILDQFDKNTLSDGSNLFKLISLKEPICFVRTAWNSVTKKTIINCWKHTQIINEKDSGDIKSIIEDDINSNIMELDERFR